MKESLFGKTLDELRQVAHEAGFPRYTATQMAGWLYEKRIDSVGGMTNLTKEARNLLSERYDTGTALPLKKEVSADGTLKYLFKTDSGHYIETAVIPENDRITVCVSSQAGCKMGCRFCMTGKQGFQGQLTTGEILNQVRSIGEAGKVTNIVYMGMGEPFDNLDNVMKSLEILTSSWGFAMSPRRITVSTIGILPGLNEFLAKSHVHLAVSLHTPFDSERKQLMPVQMAYPVSEVINEIRKWDFSHQRRVSFEYIVFKGLNDTPRHADETAKLLNRLSCRINLIRYHPVPGIDLQGSDEDTMADFKDMLNRKGILTTIRASRGQDIKAACGLLSTAELLKNKQT